MASGDQVFFRVYFMLLKHRQHIQVSELFTWILVKVHNQPIPVWLVWPNVGVYWATLAAF